MRSLHHFCFSALSSLLTSHCIGTAVFLFLSLLLRLFSPSLMLGFAGDVVTYLLPVAAFPLGIITHC